MAGRSTSPSRCPSGMDWCPLWFPLRLPRPAPSHPPPAGVATRGGRASTSPASRVRALRPRRAWPSAADAPSPRSRCSARRVRCPRCFGCGRSAPSKSRPRRTRPARCGRRASGRQGTVVAACEVRGGARVGPMERDIHTRTRTHVTRTRTRGNGVDSRKARAATMCDRAHAHGIHAGVKGVGGGGGGGARSRGGRPVGAVGDDIRPLGRLRSERCSRKKARELGAESAARK